MLSLGKYMYNLNKVKYIKLSAKMHSHILSTNEIKSPYNVPYPQFKKCGKSQFWLIDLAMGSLQWRSPKESS